MNHKQNSRAVAAKILAGVIGDKQSLTDALNQNLSSRLPGRDIGLIKEYCYGVLRWYPRLKIMAQALVYKPIKAKEVEIHALLLLGLYQLIYLQTPAYAAVSETVAAAGMLNKQWAKGLINQALHQYLNHPEKFLTLADASEEGRFAHTPWLIQAIQHAWPQQWQDILTANNQQAPMFLRVNRLQTSVTEYQQRLKNAGIAALTVPGLPQALLLQQPCAVESLPAFADGACSVQDLASQYLGGLLNLQPGQRVLDACAAPGGKTALMLETQPAIAQLVALDHDQLRLQRVQENLTRLKLTTPVQLIAEDARQTQRWWDGQHFDYIMLDAPCSGTGVIRRHPDIKLLRQSTDIARYMQTQAELLAALWPLLKPGGQLLYTTCSILPAENSETISRFCESYADAYPAPLAIPHALTQKVGQQLLPTAQSHDGFYYALLTKSSEGKLD